ncbi:hypothetical protein [Seonamhaeicola marinus]|uniref:Uncharacterized protein n=1 Tax=Seonamhaeicola marinus TaxID=1912246 RepID=A0A5D0INX1_9FLAO|nr:hypothetical protein [Seonamhaeicola marinus]TYA84077.1 hypothetical protein FUA24_05340 [Seonamhaeicola marinus]
MSTLNLYYKESGIASPLSISLSILSGAIILLFCSFFYSLLIANLSFIYLNFLIVAAYGFIVCYTSRAFNMIFKIRNRKKSIVITIILALLAIYFQWISYIFIISFDELDPALLFKEWDFFFNLLIRPDIFVSTMIDISNVGLWSIGASNGTTLKGVLLWAIWLGEAAIIIYIAVKHYLNFETIPFSEKDNKWFKKELLDFDFERVVYKKSFVEELLQNPSEAILNLKRGDGLRHSKISVFSSETEPRSLITIDNIVITQRGKGKRDVTKVLEYYYIDNLHLSIIRSKFRTKTASIFDY